MVQHNVQLLELEMTVGGTMVRSEVCYCSAVRTGNIHVSQVIDGVELSEEQVVLNQ